MSIKRIQCLVAIFVSQLMLQTTLSCTQFWVKVKNPIPPTRQPTRRSTHHDTLLTRLPTQYRHVGRHTTNAFIEKLTFPNSYFVTSFSLKQEQTHKKGGKHTNAFIEKLTFPNCYFVTSFSWKQEQRHRK